MSEQQNSPYKMMVIYASLLITFTLLALMAKAAQAGDIPPLRVCTGAEGGFYEQIGQTIAQAVSSKSGSKYELINTGGSAENAELMKDGECDMGILQADAVTTLALPRDIKVVDAHSEAVLWFHPRKGTAVIDDFGDMEKSENKKRYAVAVVSGSGAAITMDSFAKTDADYADIRRVEFDDWYAAAEAASQGYAMISGTRVEIAGMLYVGRPNFITSDITEDFSKSLVIGEINDDSFEAAKDTNGNPLYFQCELVFNKLSGMETSTTLRPDTYCMRAQVVYNNDYHANLGEDKRKVRRAIDRGINAVVKIHR